MKTLTVHVRPTCSFSAAALQFLFTRGADFRVVNLDQHPAEEQRLRAALPGRLETPTYEVDGELHVAPKLSELAELLVRWGLPGAAYPHEELKRLRG